MKIEDTKENLIKCICGQCSSYNECMKGKMEGLFCARSEAVCNFEKKGCTCLGCPVAQENDMSELYYCETGIAREWKR